MRGTVINNLFLNTGSGHVLFVNTTEGDSVSVLTTVSGCPMPKGEKVDLLANLALRDTSHGEQERIVKAIGLVGQSCHLCIHNPETREGKCQAFRK